MTLFLKTLILFSMIGTGLFSSGPTHAAERVSQCSKKDGPCLSRPAQSFFVAARILTDVLHGCIGGSHEVPTKQCSISDSESTLISRIIHAVPNEHLATTIQFRSEATEPGFFLIDGQVRVAKTGDDVGSPVFINEDLILADQTDVRTAIAILVHELGHHHKIKDHQALDRLGAAVREYANRFYSISQIETDWGALLDFELFNLNSLWNRMPGSSRMKGNARAFLWDGFDYIDLESTVSKTLCTTGSARTIQHLTMPFSDLEDLATQKQILARIPASHTCMPKFGIGTNHFMDNLNLTIPYRVRAPDSDVRIVDETAITGAITHCTRDERLPCRL